MHFVFPYATSGESGGTINYVIQKKKDLDFIILGASRAKHGIDPALLTTLGTNGHNLGINGTNVINQALVLDILLTNDVRPKIVVLQTDLYSYDKTYDKEMQILDQIKRVYPFDTPLIRSYVHDIGLVERVLYFFDSYKLNRKVINITYNALKKSEDTNGFVPLPTLPFESSSTLLFPEYLYSSTSTNSVALAKLQALAKKEDVHLILVLGPSYNNVLYNKKEQDLMLKDLRKRGFKNIINLTDITKIPVLMDKKYWRDTTHLSESGAEVFSEIVNKEISKLLFIQIGKWLPFLN